MVLYYNIIILWDQCRICGPSLTEMSLCGAYLYTFVGLLTRVDAQWSRIKTLHNLRKMRSGTRLKFSQLCAPYMTGVTVSVRTFPHQIRNKRLPMTCMHPAGLTSATINNTSTVNEPVEQITAYHKQRTVQCGDSLVTHRKAKRYELTGDGTQAVSCSKGEEG